MDKAWDKVVKVLAAVGGAIATEMIYSYPGIGLTIMNAVLSQDYPLIMGLTVFYGTFLVTMNLLVDVLYGLIDPRIRVK